MSRLRSSGCVFLVSCCFLMLIAVSKVTDPSEVAALVKIRNSLIDPMNHLRNWNKGDPCSSNWTGIICFIVSGKTDFLHVQEIQLLNMNLSGQLAPELGQLSHLRILDFMWNEITGSIPKEIGNISSLRLLLLNGNKLSGSLPDELGYLTNLNRIQVDQNLITGSIPKSFGNMISLKHIHLNNNSISGQIPSELSKLSVLLHLLVDNNNLSGPLPPELSNIPPLRILQLDNNNFGGFEIPATYANFSKLVKLSLRNCSLTGAIPDLSSMVDLFYLDLSWNNLTGLLPKQISDNMTTINLSDNRLNGSIPKSFLNLHLLQRLSLENNMLTGSVPTNIWKNMVFSKTARLQLDLRNNSLSTIVGELSPPDNVTLRLGGNPICRDANIQNIGRFCGSVAEEFQTSETSANTTSCQAQSCPTDYFYEYVPASPLPCFCAAPLRIGYRLKSPSFSYFPPYVYPFEQYLTRSLHVDLYQFALDSYSWEGARLRMYVKLFPAIGSHTFNSSEVQRIRGIYASWDFPPNDTFGPYELLNFTLQGPYSHMDFDTHGITISKGALISIILGAVACVVAVSALVTLFILRRQVIHGRKLSINQLSVRVSMKIEGVKAFTFREMTVATDNFNHSAEVGRGGYGKVYRGVLVDKTVVAIKRAEEGSLQGQKEFLTEIKLLSRLHHRNLVSLVGYCDEEGEQMLVYEFMPNGTLRDWLSAWTKEQLNFAMRLSIAIGSARGILYLHTEANPPVFHRDIKSSNILLDAKLTAKVADFGLSRLAPVLDDEGNLPNHVSTVVKGTPGYLDPEYFLTRKLTDKSDVYSLGIVFLELLTGMHPISHGKNIVREVKTAHNEGTMFTIIDSRMGSYPSESVVKFVSLALACCHFNPDRRPSMMKVVRELESIQKTVPGTGDQVVSGTMHAGESTSGSSTYTYTGNAMWSSAFYYSRDTSGSGLGSGSGSSGLGSGSGSSVSVLGSDLTSGVVPTISPR